MHVNLFKFLLRYMRFDNYRNRAEQQEIDCLAAVRRNLEHNSMANYSMCIFQTKPWIVDEQLFGYKVAKFQKGHTYKEI